MSPRELIIFLLGLAIVAVILRGLYVAMQARRGQIKLAIDKNIPQDVDLDALELAELPSGGARTVERSLAAVNSQNSAIEAANARAASLGLGTEEPADESIPVLMDPVELSEEQVREQEDFSALRFDQESFDETNEDYEDPDSVLFDYGESPQQDAQENEDIEEDELEEDSRAGMYREDNLSSVMPDYPDDEWGDDEEEDESEIPEGFQEEDFGGSTYEEEEWGEADLFSEKEEIDEEFASDEEIIAAFKNRQATSSAFDESNEKFDDIDGYDFDDEDDETDELEDRQEPALGGSFEDSLDEFTMTAGERIGYQAAEKAELSQPELFDEDPDEAEETPKEKSGFRSLLSAFSRSKKVESDSEDLREDEAIAAEHDDLDDIGDEFDEIDESTPAYEEDNVAHFEEAASAKSIESAVQQQEELSSEQDSIQQSVVIVVNVMARDGRSFDGHDLLQVLITAGLKFGEMNIFHHRLNNENKGPVIFSVANILNPGTFNLNEMDEFSTIGISLFLALPTQINNLQAFEQMLDVAQQVRGALDGELKDDHRNVMTAQTIEHYRQRIRDFELRQLKAASSRA